MLDPNCRRHELARVGTMLLCQQEEEIARARTPKLVHISELTGEKTDASSRTSSIRSEPAMSIS